MAESQKRRRGDFNGTKSALEKKNRGKKDCSYEKGVKAADEQTKDSLTRTEGRRDDTYKESYVKKEGRRQRKQTPSNRGSRKNSKNRELFDRAKKGKPNLKK